MPGVKKSYPLLRRRSGSPGSKGIRVPRQEERKIRFDTTAVAHDPCRSLLVVAMLVIGIRTTAQAHADTNA